MTAVVRATAAALLLLLAACALPPAGGGPVFTGGMTVERERELAARQAPAGLAALGGEYRDVRLAAYVSRVGTALARHAEQTDLDFRFRVADSPLPNAVAWPDGQILVTRGLLALLQDEAELAAVLAHEIGHVAGRHGAAGAGVAVLGEAATGMLALLLGRWAEAGAALTTPYLLAAHSRGQEREADALALRYLARAGYAQDALARVLERVEAEAALRDERGGGPEPAGLLARHPSTAERLLDLRSRLEPSPPGRRDAAGFLAELDGLAYGARAGEGSLVGRVYRHPQRRVGLTLPAGFQGTASGDRLVAIHPGGAGVLFDTVRVPPLRSMAHYLAQEWGSDLLLGDLKELSIAGLEAATAEARLLELDGRWRLGLLALRQEGDRVYRFRFLVREEAVPRFAGALREMAFGFRTLSAQEAADHGSLRLRLHRVAAGETVASLASYPPDEAAAEAHFRLLNGLAPEEELRPGRQVKLLRRE